jgi:hypothetical protein
MTQSTTSQIDLFSPHASLAALAVQLKARGIFEELRSNVQIAQKTIKDSPQDKLIDILMTLLCGAHSLVQINTLLRSDPALQRSLGRERCCEQSVAQQTLDAATSKTVEQMQQVLLTLFQRHSQAAAHRSRDGWLILDVDLTGIPCGKHAENSVKGYLGSHSRSRRGRQQGRVLASQYGEIVVDELYPGNTNLLPVLPALIQRAEQILNLIEWKRKHTIIRIDSGGSSVASLKSLLDRGYAVVSKEHSAQKARQLVKSVNEWIADPARPDRQIGWVSEQTWEYEHPVLRLGVRKKTKNGSWRSAVLLFAGLTSKDILTLMGESLLSDQATIMCAYAHFYDQRGGGIESSFGQDKGGLGITKRNKKRFEAARLVMLLGTLAHNLLVWSRRWLCRWSDPPLAQRLQHYGMKRMVRDLYHISGMLSFDRLGRLRAIALTSSSLLAKLIRAPLGKLLVPSHIAVILDET